MEMITMIKAMLKRSFCRIGAPTIATMANTIEEAPLRPTKEMRAFWHLLNLRLKPSREKTDTGRAIRNIKAKIASAGSIA